MLKTNSGHARIRNAMFVLMLVVAGAFALTQTSAALQQQPPSQPNTAQGQAMGPGMMGNQGQANAMMADRQQMMASMNSMDKKLADLVAKMDAARGTEKVDAIAAVVKELAAQRTQMGSQMMMMQGRMMEHMMPAPGQGNGR